MMRPALLSFALCAAVQAAPVPNPTRSTSTIDAKSNILLGRSGYIIGRSETELTARQSYDDETENEVWNYDVTPTAEFLHPSATATSSEPAFIGEEDPQLLDILVHVENILSSSASPDEQIQWILDAIVHHTESLRETDEDLWPADDILGIVDEVLDEELTDDEKVEAIFNEIVLHTKLKGLVQGPTREPVLLRVKAVLYDSGKSCLQKIKSILDEIAQYRGFKSAPSDVKSEQVSMVEIEEPITALDFDFADIEEATDVAEDADWSYSDSDMTIAYDTM